MVDDAGAVYGSDVVVKVAPPSAEEIERLQSDGVLIGFLAAADQRRGDPGDRADRRDELRDGGDPADQPRPVDGRALEPGEHRRLRGGADRRAASSAASIPMLMTAAGTIRPATVLVLGAGVAGLQAIATARRLGAVVQGFDVRAAVKEQVESLGAKFLEFDLGGDLEGDRRLRQGADARAAGRASRS